MDFMRLYDSEFDEMIKNFNNDYNKNYFICDNLKEIIKVESSLHISIIALIIDNISKKWKNEYSKDKTVEKISEYLYSVDFLRAIRFTAVIPGDDVINGLCKEEREILYIIVENGKYETWPEDNHYNFAKLLERKGILYEMNNIFNFVSKMVQRVIYYLITKPKEFKPVEIDKYNLFEFIIHCISCFNGLSLSKTILHLKEGNINQKLRESQWQHELYKNMILSLDIKQFWIISDASREVKTDGFIDFYINSKLKWAIEVLREADRIDEHINRFTKGIYKGIPKNDYIIIDFISRQNFEKTKEITNDKLMRVVYQEDLTGAEIYYGSSLLNNVKWE
jgi:hypothetical protein